MNHSKTIESLQIAEAIHFAKMFVSCSSNQQPVFGFQLEAGLSALSDEDAKQFVDEMNASTSLIRAKWKTRFENLAQQQFDHVRWLGQ